MGTESMKLNYVYGRIRWLSNDLIVIQDEHSGENVQLATEGIERDVLKSFKESDEPLYYVYFDNHVLACILGSDSNGEE